jgi:hypothetical protein
MKLQNAARDRDTAAALVADNTRNDRRVAETRRIEERATAARRIDEAAAFKFKAEELGMARAASKAADKAAIFSNMNFDPHLNEIKKADVAPNAAVLSILAGTKMEKKKLDKGDKLPDLSILTYKKPFASFYGTRVMEKRVRFGTDRDGDVVNVPRYPGIMR